ncbi:hypothetical protein GJ496_004702 [Pomphorhynchus laevis]|nr:hypothetical protein GJ496_004702 [Pomphorhynchus laevis]
MFQQPPGSERFAVEDGSRIAEEVNVNILEAVNIYNEIIKWATPIVIRLHLKDTYMQLQVSEDSKVINNCLTPRIFSIQASVIWSKLCVEYSKDL